MAVKDLDLSVRLVLFVVGHLMVFAWARYVVAPGNAGKNRVYRALPLLPVLLFLARLFRAGDPDEGLLTLIAVANFLWLIPSKIWCLAMNRGQLVKSYDSGRNGAFALGLLFTVNIAFEETPLEANRIGGAKEKHAYKDARFDVIQLKGKAFLLEAAAVVTRIIAKVALIFVMGKGYRFFRRSGQAFWADVCLGWSFYGTMSYVQEVYGLVILLTLNLKLAPNFDKPFLSQSMHELWSRRYNLVMGESLRDLIYDPVCEGQWVRSSTYYVAKSTSHARRAIAVLFTFAFSGFIHAFMLWYVLPERVPVFCPFFFVTCALVVIAENAVQNSLKMSGYLKRAEELIPAWVRILYTLGLLFVLSHLLFWPDVHAVHVDGLLADAVLHSLKLV